MLRDDEADGICVSRLDRMTRRVRHLIALVEDLFVAKSKHLMSVAEQIDTNTPMGRACLTILSAIAQLEREQIAERVKEVLQEKIRRGERTGTIPYGYQVDPCDPTGKLLVPHPGECENIELAKELRANHWSYHKIAEELTRRGIPTKTGNEQVDSHVRAPDTDASRRLAREPILRWLAKSVTIAIHNWPHHDSKLEKKCALAVWPEIRPWFAPYTAPSRV